jgi:hypothetical protein
MKRAVKFSIGLQKVTGHRGGAGPLQNERIDVKRKALGKYDDGGTPGPGESLSGNYSRCATLGREQQEQLGSNHREN